MNGANKKGNTTTATIIIIKFEFIPVTHFIMVMMMISIHSNFVKFFFSLDLFNNSISCSEKMLCFNVFVCVHALNTWMLCDYYYVFYYRKKKFQQLVYDSHILFIRSFTTYTVRLNSIIGIIVY